MPEAREAWITGIGIVSCLGEGPEAHWQGLNAGAVKVDTRTFAPYVVHPLAPIDFDKQIPKKGDQRQMEPWQRIGTYAAGLALDSAGVKGKGEILSRMDMIVAAGGGERDLAVDSTVMTGFPKAEKPDVFQNERLMSDLRPTLFLAQLSNLLAGNISIVHGVTGSSRTFMGEEAAGVDAVRIALARIVAGQSEIALVGGAHNGERQDLLLLYALGGFNLKDKFTPVWERGPRGGIALGSLGAFLVVEERQHAERRGAKPMARLAAAASDRSNRQPGQIKAALARLWSTIAARLESGRFVVISGATGAEPATGEERAFLAERPEVAVRATGSYLGHGFEPQFPMNVALAAIVVSHGKLFAPNDRSNVERPFDGPVSQVVVTGVGHWRGEGLALVEAVA
ncbi:MAG TPA: beta-ketoacyl-ACP synthase [Xanthobacteraceae bacterium]|nr:beta-ketoacyl-ACP synthase [Xanthobacteraceae bacterium]